MQELPPGAPGKGGGLGHFLNDPDFGRDLPLGPAKVLGAGAKGQGNGPGQPPPADPPGKASAADSGPGEPGGGMDYLPQDPASHDGLPWGGPDDHAFFLASGFGKHVVMHFVPGQDTLAIESNINQSGISRPEDLIGHIAGDARSVVIKIGGDTITLVGISRDDLVQQLHEHVKIV